MRHILLITLRLTLLFASCLVLSTCGSGGSGNTGPAALEAGTDSVTPGEGFMLAPPSEMLKELSLVDRDRMRLGSEYADTLPANNVTVNETGLAFTPGWVPPAKATLDDLAYAIFAFSIEGYNGDALLEVGWVEEPGDYTDLYIGLGNHVKDRWDWKPGPMGAPLDFAPLFGYLQQDGTLLVAVAMTGESPCTLSYLKVGENVPPEAAITADPAIGNIPLEVDFDASSSVDHDGSITFYSWDLDGNGGFETGPFMEPTITHTYDAAGTYDVGVWVSDNSGSQDTATVQLTVNVFGNALPVAELTADPLSGTSPLTVDFDASGSDDPDGTIAGTHWDIDNNGVFNETGPEADAEDDQTPQFTFAEIGDHPVSVRVFDDVGVSDTASVVITVNEAPNIVPEAVLHASPSIGTISLSVDFDASDSFDTDGAIVNYEWDWETDGTYDDSGPATNVNHFYNTTGTHTATVRVTDDEGGTATAYATLLVRSGGGYDEVEPNNTNETANALPAPDFSGFRGNLGEGGYDGGAEDWYSMYLYTGFIYTVTMAGFIGTNADLNIELFKWDDLTTPVVESTNTTGNQEEFNFGPIESGEYFLKCTVKEPKDASDYSLSMSYGVAVPPVAELTADPTTGSWPLTTTFDAMDSNDPDGTIEDYEWDFDGDRLFNEDGDETEMRGNANPTVELDIAGTYEVTVRVTDNMGITNTASVEMEVINEPPDASFTADPFSGDRPLTVELNASASSDPDGAIVKYEWDFDANGVIDLTKESGDSKPAEADAVFWILDPNCTLTVTDSAGQTDTEVVVIDINAPPYSEVEPNGEPETANEFPSWPFSEYWGHVGPLPEGPDPGDENDWYKFTLAEPGTVDIFCEFTHLYGDIDMFLYAEGDYSTILAQAISPDDNERFNPPPSLNSGTYYLHVEIWDGEDPLHQGGYRLSGTFEP